MSISETQYVRASCPLARHPVNLRLTIPFLPRVLFITLIVGWERRGKDWLRAERLHHPVNTWGNLLTVTVTVGVLSIATLFTMLVAAAL